MALGKRWWWRPWEAESGGAVVSKWKCANTFRSGSGFRKTDPKTAKIVEKQIWKESMRRIEWVHLGRWAIEWVLWKVCEAIESPPCERERESWRKEERLCEFRAVALVCFSPFVDWTKIQTTPFLCFGLLGELSIIYLFNTSLTFIILILKQLNFKFYQILLQFFFLIKLVFQSISVYNVLLSNYKKLKNHFFFLKKSFWSLHIKVTFNLVIYDLIVANLVSFIFNLQLIWFLQSTH